MYEVMDGGRIGKAIRELRTERKMTAEQLAAEIGTTTSAVIMYENGRRIPRDEIKIRIAVFFGKTVESIFYKQK